MSESARAKGLPPVVETDFVTWGEAPRTRALRRRRRRWEGEERKNKWKIAQ